MIPFLQKNLSLLIKTMPLFGKSFLSYICLILEKHFHISLDQIEDVYKQSYIHIEDLFQIITRFTLNLISNSSSLTNTIYYFFSIPIIIFYLLKDWDKIPGFICKIIPISYHSLVSDFFQEIESRMLSYINGQIQVCIILVFFYTVSLSYLIGVEKGIFLGTFSSIASFVPYFGSIISFIISLSIILINLDGVKLIVPVFIIFFFISLIETNFLIPNLISKKIKISPLGSCSNFTPLRKFNEFNWYYSFSSNIYSFSYYNSITNK